MRTKQAASWAALGFGAVALASYAVHGRSSTLLAPSVHRGPRGVPRYALTFDDGPSESTPRLLDLLDAHQVRATFFLLGANVRRLPCIARAIVARGHEVGSHGYLHPYYCLKTPGAVYSDIVAAQEILEDTLGFSPWLYRPPFGLRWPGMRAAQQDCGLLGVQWSLMPKDWQWAPQQIAEYLTSRIRGGDIVCLHDGRELKVNPDIRATITAVRAFLLHRATRWLRAQPISELVGILPDVLDEDTPSSIRIAY